MKKLNEKSLIFFVAIFFMLVVALAFVSHIATSVTIDGVPCKNGIQSQKRAYVKSLQLEAGIIYCGTSNRALSKRDHGFVVELVKCDEVNGELVLSSTNKYYISNKTSFVPRDGSFALAVPDTLGRLYLSDYTPPRH